MEMLLGSNEEKYANLLSVIANDLLFQHWLFSNTSSAVPQWRFKDPEVSTSLNQHLITCPFGETKDLQKEPPFPLLAYTKPNDETKSTE